MKKNWPFLSLFILISQFNNTAFATVNKNVCDDLVASGKSTEEQIQKCIAKFGESETYKANAAKKKWDSDVEKAKANQDVAIRANIETKKFTKKDIDEAGFGKAIFAIQVDYSNPRKPKEKRITEGDALCKYLGYEKALKSIVSGEIMPGIANKNGLVIDTGFFGGVKSEPELYEDKKEKYTVRRYEEITCAKVVSKDVEGTAAELGKVAEDLIVLNEVINDKQMTGHEDKAINDSSRKPAIEWKSPNGYKQPDWTKESGSGSRAK